MPISRTRMILAATLVMALGWGLRGYIGGGPFGAMIPGTMVALTMAAHLRLSPERSLIVAAFGAVAVGFGGEMTYGQTVGFVRDPATAWWGLTGLAIKGAVWGALAGAMLGLGFTLEADHRRRLHWTLVAFVLAVASGWFLVNHSKLVYFSDPIDRPREEVWFGLLAGAAATVWAARSATVGRLAAAGCVGGLAGFGLGGVWIYAGANWLPEAAWVPWWKLMEFTFGGCFGAALAWSCARNSDAIRQVRPTHDNPPEISAIVVAALQFFAVSVLVLAGAAFLPLRFAYAVIGALLLAMAAVSRRAQWTMALALPAAAFFADWAEDHAEWAMSHPDAISASSAWLIAIVAAIIFFTFLAREMVRSGPQLDRVFNLFFAAAMLAAWAKGLTDPEPSALLAAEHVLFAVFAAAVVHANRQSKHFPVLDNS